MTNAINGFLAAQQMRMQQNAFAERQQDRQRAQGQENSFMKAQQALAGGDRDAARSLAAGSGVDGYAAIQQQIAGLDERERQARRERLQSSAGVAMGMLEIPAEQRPAWVQQNAQTIAQFGLDPQQVAGLDLSDQSLQAFVTSVRNADRELFGESTAPVTLAENESRINPTTGRQTIGEAGIAARGLERQANAIQQQNADTAAAREARQSREAANGGSPVFRSVGNTLYDVSDVNNPVPVIEGPEFSASEARQFRNQGETLAAVSGALEEYRAQLEATGANVLYNPRDPAQRQLESSRMALLLQTKELFNLGVLNGPDLELMERMIGDPQGAGAIGQSTASLMAQLEIIDGYIGRARNQLPAEFRAAASTPGSSAPDEQQPITATNPQTRQRVILRNGVWEPYQ